MSADVIALVVATVAGCLGLAIALVAGGEDGERDDASPSRHRPRSSRAPSVAVRWAVGSIVALVVLAFSGWVLPAVIAGVGAGAGVRAVQQRDRSSAREIERTDALASWIESLRDVLLAGDQPIGAISATVPSAPHVIRPQVRRLSAALAHQSAEVAIRRFADDIDDPLGDLVAAGLLIAVQRGARTVAVLSALADQARSQADRRRVVEAERAPVRREVTLLTLIMGSLVVGVLLFGRVDYLDAYDTAEGQLFLTVVLVVYALLLARVQRLSRYPRPQRFLTVDRLRRDEDLESGDRDWVAS